MCQGQKTRFSARGSRVVEARADVEMENSAQTGIDEDHRLWIALVDDESGVLAVMVGGPATNWTKLWLRPNQCWRA
jgi:hypothetical protein